MELGDFRAAYCESRATAHALDPYSAAVVERCEDALAEGRVIDDTVQSVASPGVSAHLNVTPLAPFTFALLAPLALFPYDIASQLYLCGAVVLVSIAIYALRRITDLPMFGLTLTFALGAGLATFTHGTLVPATLACIALSAVLLRRGEDGWAGLVAAGSLIDPLAGIAICTSLAVWRPATRLPLAASALVLMLLSIAAVGQNGVAEYYFDVLPGTLLQNAFDGSQYGLAYLLHEGGVSQSLALAAQLGWDFIVVAGTIPIARRFARMFRSASAYSTVPPAVVLLGGSIVDLSHVALALPATCIALVAARIARLRLLCALVLIAVPWPVVAQLAQRLPYSSLRGADLGAGSIAVLLKSPTWVGLLLLFLILTRSRTQSAPVPARAPLGEH